MYVITDCRTSVITFDIMTQWLSNSLLCFELRWAPRAETQNSIRSIKQIFSIYSITLQTLYNTTWLFLDDLFIQSEDWRWLQPFPFLSWSQIEAASLASKSGFLLHRLLTSLLFPLVWSPLIWHFPAFNYISGIWHLRFGAGPPQWRGLELQIKCVLEHVGIVYWMLLWLGGLVLLSWHQ